MKRLALFATLAAVIVAAGCINQSSTVNVYGHGPDATNGLARAEGVTNRLSGTLVISVALDMYAPKTITPDTDLSLPVK